MTFTARLLGGRWKARIVWQLLRSERLRFSELRRSVDPISDRILSKELKDLERWGIIERRDYGENPPRTDYGLTAMGLTLRPLMASMAEWGDRTQTVLAEVQT